MGAFSHFQEIYDNSFNINVSLPPLNSSIFAQEGLVSQNFFLKSANEMSKKPQNDINDM